MIEQQYKQQLQKEYLDITELKTLKEIQQEQDKPYLNKQLEGF